MKQLKVLLITVCLISIESACSKQSNDGFPTTRFVGYFNLHDPRYSGDSFMASEDMDGSHVGIAGIIVYRISANEYAAFERMCPYEKKITCRATLNPNENPFEARCDCCGSRFLISIKEGGILEGPSKWALKTYNTSVQGSILTVSSFFY